jgi:1-acyl-sn-glycerol-3-phosphate acyltransferase
MASGSALVAAILHFLDGHDPQTLSAIRSTLEHEIDRAGRDALTALGSSLAADAGWDYRPPDTLARRLHHRLADRFLDPASRVAGTEHLASVLHQPVIIVSNHLSYADANVIEVLLHRSEGAPLADRMTALAGPKVFSDRRRRFSSLCFGTIKVPQSAEVSSEEAVLSPRDVARAARRAIEVANGRLQAGDALLLFGEGTRSRTAEMQPMLAAAARYLEAARWVLPAGLVGSESLFPVGGSTVQPARVALRLGEAIRADTLRACAAGDRRVIMDAIGLAVAALLPPSYRGVYADADRYVEARDVLMAARGASVEPR